MLSLQASLWPCTPSTPLLWPLSSMAVRLSWLRACCAVAEGADVPLCRAVALRSPLMLARRRAPDACVAAVLTDALHRVAVLGGREGMPRSLGSVYGGSVTRFLGGSFRGVVSRVYPMEDIDCSWVEVSHDSSTLLVAGLPGYDNCSPICVLSAADGSMLMMLGAAGSAVELRWPGPVSLASDGFMFIADYGTGCVVVLSPELDLHGFVGEGQFSSGPFGVCANDDVVVATEGYHQHRVVVFRRSDGSVVTRFGGLGRQDGFLCDPAGVCLMSNDSDVVVCDGGNDRVCIFTVEGVFIRAIGEGVLCEPSTVACSRFDELVVADWGNCCVRMFSDVGDLLMTLRLFGTRDARFNGVAVHGSRVFGQVTDGPCVVWS